MKQGAGPGAGEVGSVPSRARSVAAEPLAPGPAPVKGTGEGHPGALAPSPRSLPGRLRESVWMPVLTKTAGIFAGMLALAGIGAWSTLQGAGVPLALASAAASAPSASPSAAHGASASAAPPADTPVSAPPPSASGASPSPPSENTPASPSGVTADGRVILNLATAEDLMRLPRVGAKRAENILALRKKLGRFKQPADLLRVKGIGRKTLQLMLPKLVLDPPKEAAAPAP